MLIDKKVRVDKWLWAVRIYKTRSQASEACKKGRVLIDKQVVKPSRVLKINDVVQISRPPVMYSFRVKGLLGKRMSARVVQEYVDHITPDSELQKLTLREAFFEGRFIRTGHDHSTGKKKNQYCRVYSLHVAG